MELEKIADYQTLAVTMSSGSKGIKYTKSSKEKLKFHNS